MSVGMATDFRFLTYSALNAEVIHMKLFGYFFLTLRE